MITNPCQCNRLARVVVGGFEFKGLHCPHCVDMVLEAKNELVRENNRLRAELEGLRPPRGRTYRCGCPAVRSSKLEAFCPTHVEMLAAEGQA